MHRPRICSLARGSAACAAAALSLGASTVRFGGAPTATVANNDPDCLSITISGNGGVDTNGPTVFSAPIGGAWQYRIEIIEEDETLFGPPDRLTVDLEPNLPVGSDPPSEFVQHFIAPHGEGANISQLHSFWFVDASGQADGLYGPVTIPTEVPHGQHHADLLEVTVEWTIAGEAITHYEVEVVAVHGLMPQVDQPLLFAPNPGTAGIEIQLKAPHDPAPFVHWDLREFDDCEIPWAISGQPVPDLDGDGMTDGFGDLNAAITEITNAFATWTAVSPALPSFAFTPLAFVPTPTGLALDHYNSIGFGNGPDDVQVVAVGGNLPAGGIVVAPGQNGRLESVPGGDDFVLGANIVDGGNNVADSVARIRPDDGQVRQPGAIVAVGTVLVNAGINGVLETQPGGDDVVFGNVIVDGGNNVAETPANQAPDDVQVVAFGGAVAAGGVIVAPGLNGGLETHARGDDVFSGTSIVDGGNGIAETRAGGLGVIEPGDLGLTALFFHNGSGVVIEADIILSPLNTWVVGGAPNNCNANLFNLEGVVTHEIGHFMGLAHPNAAGAAVADAADGGSPTMTPAVCPAFHGNAFNRTLETLDTDPFQFLYTPDLGDAPDPFAGVFNEYPSLVHTMIPSRTLNDVQLFEPAAGAEHLFGYFGPTLVPCYQYEWLAVEGGKIDDHPLECEARFPDAFDDGVVFGGPFVAGGAAVPVNVTIQTATDIHGNAHAYGATPMYLNGWFDWNADGDWEDAGEHVIGAAAGGVAVAPAIVPSSTTLVFNIAAPAGANPGGWARFRLDWGEDVNQVMRVDPTLALAKGAAQFGEVEDYPLEIDPGSDDCGGVQPGNFCMANPFSTGSPSTISANSLFVSIAANDLVLSADNLPLQPGQFIASQGAFQAPFQNGFLCVAPASLQRLLPVNFPSASGVATLAVDFVLGAQGIAGPQAVNVVAGTTHYFQRWNRDPSVGAGSNLSDGIAICLTP